MGREIEALSGKNIDISVFGVVLDYVTNSVVDS
jgi:hypothetical protein